MKKSIKILALILTLALVCGVFVIGAFATDGEAVHVGYDYGARETVTGEDIITWMDFEEIPTAVYGPATDGGTDPTYRTNNGGSSGLVYKGRQGEASIVAATKGAANKYLQIDMTADSLHTSGQGPYVPYHLQEVAGTATDAETRWNVNDAQYIVIDADVYFPTTLSGSPSFNVQFRTYDSTGARQFPNTMGFDGNNIKWEFTTVDGDWQVNGASIVKESWTHLTAIAEMNVLTDESGVAYTQVKVYTIVDGVLGSTVKVIDNQAAAASGYYNSDKTFVVPFEARMQFGSATDGTQFLSDNVAVRRLDNTYAGNLAELLAEGSGTDMTAWDGNVYDPYNMPYGTTVATREVDGEVVEYDNLQKAINEAEEEETITLVSSVTKTVAVEKALFIDRTDAGYTCEFANVEGYAITTGDTMYTIEPATEGLTVYWHPCDCGNDCFEEAEIVVYEGANIYEAYKSVMGYYPVCSPVEDAETHTIKKLVGFADTTGVIADFTEDTVVTAEMVGETVELEPVYEIDYPILLNVNKDAYYYAPTTLKNVIDAASDGDTIKLLQNIEVSGEVGVSRNNLTLDLNGKRISSLCDVSVKYYLFSCGNRKFTVCSTATDSVGAIYHAARNGSAWQGNPVFSAGASGLASVVGSDAEGNTTVRIYCAVLFNNWSGDANYSVDGGEYYRTASDHEALFYFRGSGTGTVKNAYIYADKAFCFGGNSATSNATYIIDNCVIDSDVISTRHYKGLSVTFTNCYINGSINPSTVMNADVTAPDAGTTTHTIGEGCFIKEGVTLSNVAYAGTEYSVNVIKTITSNKNDFKATDLYAITTSETAVTYDRLIAPEGLEEIEVIWVDTEGNEIARTMAFPGLETSAPAAPVEGTNGMVNATYSDWVGGTLVPLDAEDGYTFTLAEDSGVVYTAGKIDIKFNFDMINHIQYNFYVPEAPEGITYVGAKANASSYSFGTWNFANNFRFTDSEGVKYTVVNAWPSAHNTDTDFTFMVTYTYDGQEFTYTAPAINLAKYVNYILEAEKYSEYEEIKTVMADLLRMVEQANVAAGQTTDSAFDAVYAKAEEFMTDTANVIDPADTNDLSSVEAYLDDVKLAFVSGLGAMTVGVKAKDGYIAVMEGKERVHGQNAIGDNRKIDSTGYIYAHNVRTYALSEIIVIKFYAVGDTIIDGQIVRVNTGAAPVATVEFTMSGYVNDNVDSFSDVDKDLVDAFFAYAYSAGQYMDWRSRNLGKA